MTLQVRYLLEKPKNGMLTSLGVSCSLQFKQATLEGILLPLYVRHVLLPKTLPKHMF